MKLQRLYKSISEKDAERLCRNIAVALRISNIAFYETSDWIEIIYDRQCISLRANYIDSTDKFKKLLNSALYWLLDNKILKTFSLEQAMINVDLQENHETDRQ